MARKKLRAAAGHYHLFHRVAPTVAQTKGYFSKRGVDVDISATGTDLKSLEALSRGEIDIVVDLKTPLALQARDRGEEVFLTRQEKLSKSSATWASGYGSRYPVRFRDETSGARDG